MSEITIHRVAENTVEITIEQNRSEAHIVRVYRQHDGTVRVSWPMLQDVDARTTRLYAEALLIASRIAEEFALPCPHCGGTVEIHRKKLVGVDDVATGHVYRCVDCGEVMG